MTRGTAGEKNKPELGRKKEKEDTRLLCPQGTSELSSTNTQEQEGNMIG